MIIICPSIDDLKNVQIHGIHYSSDDLRSDTF